MSYQMGHSISNAKESWQAAPHLVLDTQSKFRTTFECKPVNLVTMMENSQCRMQRPIWLNAVKVASQHHSIFVIDICNAHYFWDRMTRVR